MNVLLTSPFVVESVPLSTDVALYFPGYLFEFRVIKAGEFAHVDIVPIYVVVAVVSS